MIFTCQPPAHGKANRLFPYSTAQPLYEGRIDVSNCTTVSGWALDRRQPNTALNVSLYVDGGSTPAATVTAKQSRPDLINCAGENGLHGFTWAVPQSLRDDNAHTVRVKYGSTAIELGGSPSTITCSGVTPPPAASGLSAIAASASQIYLQWQYADTTNNGFVIQRGVDGVGYSDYATITTPTVTTNSDIGLTAGHRCAQKSERRRASDPDGGHG